jgi:hypothetical protein
VSDELECDQAHVIDKGDGRLRSVTTNGVEGSVRLCVLAKIHATPKASASGPDFARAGRDGSGGDDLATECARELHATPRSADFRSPLVSDEVFGGNARPLCEQAGKARRVAAGLSLNADGWLEAYQGWPVGWTDPAATVDLDDWPGFTRDLWATTRDSFADWPWRPLARPVKGLTRRRISALGDGQVPQCMAEAYRRLCR